MGSPGSPTRAPTRALGCSGALSPCTAALPAASETPAPWRRCPGARRGSAVPTRLLNLNGEIKQTSERQPARGQGAEQGAWEPRTPAPATPKPQASPPVAPQAALCALAVSPLPSINKKKARGEVPAAALGPSARRAPSPPGSQLAGVAQGLAAQKPPFYLKCHKVI